MLGREAYQNPYLLAEVDHRIYNNAISPISRSEVIQQFVKIMSGKLLPGMKISHVTRHILGLYKGIPGGRKFRQHISENVHQKNADINILIDALRYVEEI